MGPHLQVGIVDHDCWGEVWVLLFILEKKPVHIQPGDRVAQVICEQIALPEVRNL